MSKTLVKCQGCDGTGKASLSLDMERTLSAVAWDSWRSTQDIFKRVNDPSVGATAINNRLRYLEAESLIASERRGKALYWKRAKLNRN